MLDCLIAQQKLEVNAPKPVQVAVTQFTLTEGSAAPAPSGCKKIGSVTRPVLLLVVQERT